MENTILDKIKKLILKQQSAESNGSTEEAETFAIKIQELLNKHNLDKSEINLEEDKKDEMVADRTMESKIKGIGSNTSYTIMDVICDFNWCKVYYTGSIKHNKMLIIGAAENIEICKYLHSFLVNFVMKDGKEKYNQYKAEWLEEYKYRLEFGYKPIGFDTYMRSFIKGFADGVRLKFMREQKKFMLESEKSTALVRTNELILKEFVEVNIGKVKTKDNDVKNYNGSYDNGLASGMTVKITKGIESASKPIERKMLG